MRAAGSCAAPAWQAKLEEAEPQRPLRGKKAAGLTHRPWAAFFGRPASESMDAPVAEPQQNSAGSQSGNQDIVLITEEPLVLGALAARVVCGTAGGIATFIGTTRDNFEGQRVLRLEYEAYQPMAEREMLAICQRMRDRWPLRHVAIAHRIGLVPIGESSVEIAVSSAHRREALEAVQFAIDDLKAHVPIWKKEVYEGDAAAWKENAEAAQNSSSIQNS